MKNLLLALISVLMTTPGFAENNLNFSISTMIGNFEKPGETAYLVKNEDGIWSYQENADVSKSGVERIKINLEANRPIVYLDAPVIKTASNNTIILDPLASKPEPFQVCFSGIGGTPPREQGGYSVCSSFFTRMQKSSAVTGTILAPFSLLLKGSLTHTVELDKQSFGEAIKNSGVVEKLAEKLRLFRYREIFSQAKTSSQFFSFVKLYSGDDPDNLIPVANAKIIELKALEAEAENREKAKTASEQEKKQILEQRSRDLRILESAEFRKTVSVGMETNCGAVIEIRHNLVKVYHPVANYGNEHWLRRAELYPPSYGCTFFNGNYMPPTP